MMAPESNWLDDLDRRERLCAGLAHLDRLAVGGTVESVSPQPLPRKIAYAVIAMISALLWAGIVYGVLVAVGVE